MHFAQGLVLCLDRLRGGISGHHPADQAAVSKMERRADMYISTLQSMIRAMGGQLKIEAVFPEGKVEINQFRKLKKAAGAD